MNDGRLIFSGKPADLTNRIHDRSLQIRRLTGNRRQLLAAGVPEENITALKDCTVCQPKKFFSHRGERGKTGRQMALIGIK